MIPGLTWGDRGYAYIQRGIPNNACGLGCVNFYPFYGVGGVAYVNGTEFADDDFVDYQAQDERLRLVFTYAMYVLGGMAIGFVLMAMGQLGSYIVTKISRRRRAGTLQEPLLTSEMLGEEAEA